jgi:SPP1 gp7 family putative phage head morphogenesis protein
MKLPKGTYWKERMEVLERNRYRASAEYYEDLKEQFTTASYRMQEGIEKWYRRLAANNGINYANARKYLNESERKEFTWTVKQYIEAGKENAVNKRWIRELENASAKVHISYLEALKIQINQQAELLAAQENTGLAAALKDIYADTFYHTAYEIHRGLEVGSNLARLDAGKIDAIIRKPWAQDGKYFSDRIWTNRDKLIGRLHTELSQSIIRGLDPMEAIKNIAKDMDVSKRQAGALVMTESAAIASASQKNCYKELGVEKYEILATLDSQTSEICRELDGEVFDMKDYAVGTTAPPFHVWCRSVTIPYFDDEFTIGEERAARDEETGKTYYVPGNTTYKKWKEAFVDNGSKDGFKELSPEDLTPFDAP